MQANLLHVGVWRVKPVDSNLRVNTHCYLLLTLASSYGAMKKKTIEIISDKVQLKIEIFGKISEKYDFYMDVKSDFGGIHCRGGNDTIKTA